MWQLKQEMWLYLYVIKGPDSLMDAKNFLSPVDWMRSGRYTSLSSIAKVGKKIKGISLA